MSDQEPEIDPIRQQRDHIEQLEAQLAAQREQVDLASALNRENAMLKAGVDVESALGQMFSRAYDGELTVEAIRTQASEIGALAPTAPPSNEPEITPEEQQAGRERAALGADAGSPQGLPEVDPVQQGWTEYHADLKRGVQRDTAAGNVIGSMIAAANDGDPRYRYTPETWKAQQEERMGIR
jgi:small-conductance mechanosensitive channel